MNMEVPEGKATFAARGHNPDVLSCIANLSNDEVFTPPELANRMLDTVAEAWADSHGGSSIWEDPEVTFLDPFTKTGVFLREITRRLTEGLAERIPDLDERVDHILTKQVFGIGITQLTALLARRSVYCSKDATGEHSIASSFTRDWGNIWFERTEHTWAGPRCGYCGASKAEYGRSGDLETHAYAFIHSKNIKKLLASMFGAEVQFDVIIGNPPYQLDDGGYGTSAVPIYDRFVDQAKRLEPRLVCLVIPARWFAGGKGLDSFRERMLEDQRLRVLHDFPDSNDVFPGTQIKGGVCYFLWNRDSAGYVTVTTHDRGRPSPSLKRPLLEDGADVFIRYNEALPILRGVMRVENGGEGPLLLNKSIRFVDKVSTAKPFGLRTFFQGDSTPKKGAIRLYQNGGVGFVDRSEITKNQSLIDQWKVFVPRAGSGSDSFPHSILGRPIVGGPGSASTETYNCVGPFGSEDEAKNVVSYISTRLFRFLVLLHKPSQDANRVVYSFVPLQDFSRPWTDEALYAKYGITEDEIAFIESMVRPMELDDA